MPQRNQIPAKLLRLFYWVSVMAVPGYFAGLIGVGLIGGLTNAEFGYGMAIISFFPMMGFLGLVRLAMGKKDYATMWLLILGCFLYYPFFALVLGSGSPERFQSIQDFLEWVVVTYFTLFPFVASLVWVFRIAAYENQRKNREKLAHVRMRIARRESIKRARLKSSLEAK